jgi:5-enolpyruvylshikimate-3-phosphate synthase
MALLAEGETLIKGLSERVDVATNWVAFRALPDLGHSRAPTRVTVEYAGPHTGAEVPAKAIPSLINEISILALVAAGGGQ